MRMRREPLQYYIHDEPDALRFELSGSLSGDGALSVHQAWRTALSILGGRPVIADITFVVDADQHGRDVLQAWHRSDVRIIAASRESRAIAGAFLGEQLTQSTGKVSWREKGTHILLWAMQVLAAAVFLAAGGIALSGAAPLVAIYEEIGIGQWFRYVTGILEIAGAVALLLPRFAFYGAALLATVMCGAIVANFTILGVLSPIPAFVLLLWTGAIAFLLRGR